MADKISEYQKQLAVCKVHAPLVHERLVKFARFRKDIRQMAKLIREFTLAIDHEIDELEKRP